MRIKATIEVEIDAESPTEAADALEYALDACAPKFRAYAIEVIDTNVQEA